MLYSKIMVPYDGSEHAKHALEYAKGLAGASDAKIAIVHVVPSGVMGVDQVGTEGSLDGVPFGMLNYDKYEGVVKAALDQAKEKVEENLSGLTDGIDDVVIDARRCARALRRQERLRPHRHGAPWPRRHPRHARKRELRASALDRCSRSDGKIGK